MQILLIVIGLILLNRAAYLSASAAGMFCHGTPAGQLRDVTSITCVEGFRTNAMSWPSGLRLHAGRRYRLTLEITEAWVDKSFPADTAGFPSRRHWIFLVFFPLKRWWTKNWFTPIARIDTEEYALQADDAVPARVASVIVEPRRPGELFLFVNDAVLMLPRFVGYFTANNIGAARITVEPLD